MLLNRFTFDGKTYTATPASHVRIGDTVLRVVKTDADGNAEVELEPNKKKHAGAVEATEETAPEAEKKPSDDAGKPSALAGLKAAWAEKEATREKVRAEQEAIEVDIARELKRLKAARGDVPTVMLGKDRYKAQGAKGDPDRVSLVKLATQNVRDC